MNWLDITLLSILAFFTSVISGVAGMGGGVTFLAGMTFLVPYQLLIPLHGTTQLISNLSRALFLFKHINKNIFLYFNLGLPFGIFIAVELIKSLTSKTFPMFLLALLISYTLFKPKKLPHLKIPIWSFSLVGFIAGILGILVGATGPFIAVYFLRNDLTKEEIVSTKATVQMAVHLYKIPAFLFLGFNYLEYLHVILLLAASTVFGSNFGVKILKKVDETLFRKIYRLALFAALLRILYLLLYP
ncbi:MAG: sulfite exporter TauE/SafE family protein [Bdellovibrionales bacterium]|nr:sulfite exporter TauE/SafE family protein [Bdellovibrionales bacterium]